MLNICRKALYPITRISDNAILSNDRSECIQEEKGFKRSLNPSLLTH